MMKDFESYLLKQNLSANTIRAYCNAVEQFYSKYQLLNSTQLMRYKVYLIEHYKPQTVNLRICALNSYLNSIQRTELRMPIVKIQQKPFLERVISEPDYIYFKNCLRRDDQQYWYFVIRFLAATGARVSELTQIKCEHIRIGYLDLYSKGGKLRRLYIPSSLRREALIWLDDIKLSSGFIFINKYGDKMSARGIANQLKHFASLYGIDPNVVYPHSFRHRFAKSFLERCNDIALLADLMGHESIETTRIYLRKTNSEQQEIVDQVIDW